MRRPFLFFIRTEDHFEYQPENLIFVMRMPIKQYLPEEMMAIRWHMSAWDLPTQSPEHKESLNAAKAKTPLVSLVQLADGFATGILER